MAKSGGFGVQLKITISASLAVIAQLKDMDLPEQVAKTADVTTHDSTSGYAEKIKTGLFELTTFTATLVWDDSIVSHTGVVAAFSATTPVTMNIVTPSSAETIAFSGFVTKLGRESKQDGALMCKVEITPTGAPTIT
jgi:predicted secreted protein